MRRSLLIIALALAASVSQAQYDDPLYGPSQSKKDKTESRQKSAKEASSVANSSYSSYATEYDQKSEPKELLTTYETALERRISALRNYTEQGENYWKLLEQYQAVLERKYNQDLYNIVVVGNDMWVEPQFITAQFNGSDPAQGVIKYNDQIRAQINNKTEATQSSSSNSQYQDEQASNITIQVNVIDPWDYNWWSFRPSYYSYWGGGFGFNFGWGGSWGYPYWGGGYYPPYWGGGYYPPYWGGGYYPPYWGSSYYSNPRGTYYGNSRYNNHSGGGNANAIGGGRSQGTFRPNGQNTISGTGGGRGSIGGSVATVRPDRPTYNRGQSSGYSRPTNGSSNRPTYQRPTTTQRPTYDRPTTTQRPTTTYERPTYERPTTTQRPTYDRPTTSRPSGGSMGGGRSGGGSMGGGRSGGGRR